MNEQEYMETDVAQFFKQIENQTRSDQVATLKLLLEKYSHLSTSQHCLDIHDLFDIHNGAKQVFSTLKMPVIVKKGFSTRAVPEEQYRTICVILATIGVLNKHGCFKKQPILSEEQV